MRAVSSSMASRLHDRCGHGAAGWPARDQTRASVTTSTLADEIRPRSATTQIRPTANRWARSVSTAGKVAASLVFPANT